MATGKRRNTGAKRSAPTKRPASRNDVKGQNSALKKEITLILVFAACILVFLCNFPLMGSVGDGVKQVMFGLFGVLSYVIPLVIFVGVAFRISNRGNSVATRKLIAGGLIVYIIGIFLHMLSVPNETVEGNLIANLYSVCSTEFKGGGVLCGLPSYGLTSLLTTVGTILVLLVILIICLVIITEKSFIGGVQKGTRKVYEKTKEESARIRENYRNRRENEAAYTEYENASTEKEPSVNVRMERAEKVKKQKEADMPTKKRSEGFRIAPPDDLHKGNMHEIILNENVFVKPKEMEMREALKNAARDSWGEGAFEADIHPVTPSIHEEASQSVTNEIALNPYETNAYAADEMHEIEMPTSGANVEETLSGAQQDASTVRTKPVIPRKSTEESVSTHSFGMTEPYKTPEEKAREAKDLELQKANEAKLRAQAKSNEALAAQGGTKPVSSYKLPPLSLLKKGNSAMSSQTQELEETKCKLQQVLETFGVKIKPITHYSMGPSVTRYEIEPEMGVKVSRIAALADDIKLNLAAADIRIEAPIPGKAAVGIEIPNKTRISVGLRELLESSEYQNFESKLGFAVGKDLTGQTVVSDIAKMPHVLIAGTTGSGKSVFVNTLIMSILFKAKPDEVQFIMVDPKVVEFKMYNGIPHLVCPVVTEPKKAAAALQWAVAEMTERYKKFADNNVRDLKGYNNKIAASSDGTVKKLPQIVIIVDELADLMMVAGKEVEESIVRLSQLARAAGIHLVIATQRPSVNVVTGLIKANMPSRVALSLSNGVDSRTILDMNGAEKLLGNGDMLFYPQGYTKPARVQGAFVSDNEVADVVEYILKQGIAPVSDVDVEASISSGGASEGASGSGSGDADTDELLYEAAKFIIEKEKASIGMLQRQFRIGFNRAARIMDELARYGVVGEEEGTKPRRILMTLEEFEASLG